MSQHYKRVQWLALVVLSLLTSAAFAQKAGISGVVRDDKKQGLAGATVLLEPGKKGTITDLDGNYQFQGLSAGQYTLTISYVGFQKQTKVVSLKEGENLKLTIEMASSTQLNEMVVIGYGTQKKSDLTGSVATISSKDFVQGNIQTADQLIQGKVAGVQITSNGGAPGAGSRIRIRGGSSLNASNDPLIVIDGVPIDNGGIGGSANPLNLINPNDIENITILKDASAAAIYGNRASNGVIIITTKKGAAGSSKLQVNVNTVNSVSQLPGKVDVLTGDELRKLIAEKGNSNMQRLVGTANTDWQEEIYRLAMSTDNNISFSGGIKNLPYRASIGYLKQDGILKRSTMDRLSGALNLNPTFFKNHLKVDMNLRSAMTQNFFADQGAIGSAVTFDPTQPVNSDTTAYGGYFEWLDPTTRRPNVLAPRNPVSLLNSRSDQSTVYRTIGNVQLDYKLHFLPELRLNLNLGMDEARGNGTIVVDSNSAAGFFQRGTNNQYNNYKRNQVIDFYGNYVKELPGLKSKIDLTAGYSWQDWYTSVPAFPNLNQRGDTITRAGLPFKTQNTLVSFYGRLNYTLNEKYLLTVTVRQDGSSRFSPDTRWGLFPSAALAWRLKEEGIFRNMTTLSNLKLRVGYGVTGQQDIGSDFPYLARYTFGDPAAQYQFGNNFYTVIRPDGYDANLRWEQTATSNIALDFGFWNGRLNGSVDFYIKNTSDLLAVIPIPAGSNFTNQILTNVGSIRNQGVEFTLNAMPIAKKDMSWEVGFNMTYNVNEITQLSRVGKPEPGILVGGIAGGVGNTIQIQSVGYQTQSFFVMKQKYDESGKPLEGQFEDLNGDGRITADDRYRTNFPDARIFLGFNTTFTYKKWSLGTVLRANLGNYVYNNVRSNLGTLNAVNPNGQFNQNIHRGYFDTEFTGRTTNENLRFLSDLYLEDASFLRMDNLNLGYNFGKVLKGKVGLTANFLIQNVFVATKYTGLDPEVAGGIDNNFYPRPRIYSLALNFNF